MTAEHRQKISLAHQGKHYPALKKAKMGHQVSAEVRQRIREKLTGRKTGPRSQEAKDNISRALKGKTFSARRKRNMSLARTGKPVGERARQALLQEAYKLKTPETRKHMSQGAYLRYLRQHLSDAILFAWDTALPLAA